jgi:predicted metal-dependent HD superfamily phosphohydrolase
MLKETYYALLAKYTKSNRLISEFWKEIEKAYTHKARHYHTLQHLNNVLILLTEVKPSLHHWDLVLFALYYHDVVYDAQRTDNEEKSADFAESRLKQTLLPTSTISQCKQIIMATKTHAQAVNNDTNYFTDADLAILGQPWQQYQLYAKAVREEYIAYPDVVYKRGREKALRHFLSMPHIFKTSHFQHRFEAPARANISKELAMLKL